MSSQRNSPQQCILTEISCGGALPNYPLGSSSLQPHSLAASPLPRSTCTGMMDHYRIADARALELSPPSSSSSSSKWQMIHGSSSNKWSNSPSRSSMQRSPALETISVAYSQVFDNPIRNTTYSTNAPGGPSQFMDGSGGYPAAAAGEVSMLSGESLPAYGLPAASSSLGSTAAAAMLGNSTNSFDTWDPLTREQQHQHHHGSTLGLTVDSSNGGFAVQRGGGATVAPSRPTSAASQSLTRFAAAAAAANLGGFAERAARFTTFGSGSPSSPSPVSPSFPFAANGNAGHSSLFDHHNDGTTSSKFAKDSGPVPGQGIASRSTTASELGPELVSASRISASPYGHDSVTVLTEGRRGPSESGRIETIIGRHGTSSEPPTSTSRGPGFASASASAACCSNADHHHDRLENNNNKLKVVVKEQQRENAACPGEEEKLVASDSDASDFSRGEEGHRGRHDSPSGFDEVALDLGSSTPSLTPTTPSTTGIAGRKRRTSPTEPSRGKTAVSPISKDPRDSSSESSKRCKDGSGSGRAVPTGERPKSPFRVGEPSGSSDSRLPNSKEALASKNSVEAKLDYIHVRARRGQATDSHSLAERVRREKISERMKYLQDLVPGCSKITGKALMLDEIINYVQSIQRQVEFLSMKLASITPSPEFNVDNILSSQPQPQPQPQIQIETAYRHPDAEMPEHSAPSLHFGHAQAQQAVQVPRNIQQIFDLQTPVSIQRTLPEEFDVRQTQAPSIWDGDLQCVVQMGLLGQHRHGHRPSDNSRRVSFPVLHCSGSRAKFELQ